MNLLGLSTSLGIAPGPTKSCVRCRQAARVANHLCLNCLLQTALVPETGEGDDFGELLAEVNMQDAEWQLGNYQILEEIGRGGMGIIYRARQETTGRIVALKRALSFHADSTETMKRFRREAEAAACLDHPNILPIYEVAEEAGLPFFSMKFAAGGSLTNARLALRHDVRRCVALAAKVARAVQHAHEQQILHRDLKPGNILLDHRGEPLVSDFGLATWLDTSTDLTQSLTIFGTPGYIAPEQGRGADKALPATDIYSLGAVLYDLLTGRPPFLGEHALAVLRESAEKPAPRLRTVRPELDRDLETICDRCLEREPEARYASAAALAEDLERWLEGRSIVARPVSLPTKTLRWCRRNKTLAATTTACLLLAGAVAWLGIAYYRGAHARELASLPAFVAPEKSVAVLPFENQTGNEDGHYLAYGIHEDILSNLAKVADLKVAGSESVRRFSSGAPRDFGAIARALGVRYLVEGSVRRDGEKIRVDAHLVDAMTNAHRWREHYERNVSDVFDIQRELAQAIAYHLQAKLTVSERVQLEQPPTRNLKAYQLYARASELASEAKFSTRIGAMFLDVEKLLNQATALDPDFFRAYCLLAYAHDWIYFSAIDHTPQRVALGSAALKQAFRLRPNAGEAHIALARHYYLALGDWPTALAELAIAQKTLPNDSFIPATRGYIARRGGHWDEAVQQFQTALDLDPRNFFILQELALTYHLQRHFRAMGATLERALAVVPQSVVTRVFQSCVALQRMGDTRPARDTLDAIVSSQPQAAPQLSEFMFRVALYDRDSDAVARAVAVVPKEGLGADSIRFPRSWCQGVLARMRGDVSGAHVAFLRARQEAQEFYDKQPGFPATLCVLGMIDATLGRKDDAIAEGRKAVALLPLHKDSINGAHARMYLAAIYAWTGEQKLALDQLEELTKIPSDITYGMLLLDPMWDPLRGEPRFDQLRESLAPKTP